jgi:hypothetical protein
MQDKAEHCPLSQRRARQQLVQTLFALTPGDNSNAEQMEMEMSWQFFFYFAQVFLV